MNPFERLKELLGCMENAIQKGDEMHLCFETNMSKADAVLIQAWNGPLGLEALEWLKHRATNQIHYDSRAKVIYDKINALGKPEPAVDWYALWESYTLKNNITWWVICSPHGNKRHHIHVIPRDDNPIASANTSQDCYRQACKWAGIEPEA